jgi:hypothetical protein
MAVAVTALVAIRLLEDGSVAATAASVATEAVVVA